MVDRKIVLASGNAGKLRELVALFHEPVLELVSLRSIVPSGLEVEETGATFSENAWLKALAVCEHTGLPALADDSGLEVDALGGRPGVHSARFSGAGATDDSNNQKLLSELVSVPLAERRARFRSVLALAAPGSGGPTRVAEACGAVEGTILFEPRGSFGFGYDPLFELLELPGRTAAELSLAEKNRISHRARAAQRLRPAVLEFLEKRAAATV